MTRTEAVPMVTKRQLAPLIGRYISIDEIEET
jgi:hypothetical protein